MLLSLLRCSLKQRLQVQALSKLLSDLSQLKAHLRHGENRTKLVGFKKDNKNIFLFLERQLSIIFDVVYIRL